jgi:hypothetical protein
MNQEQERKDVLALIQRIKRLVGVRWEIKERPLGTDEVEIHIPGILGKED